MNASTVVSCAGALADLRHAGHRLAILRRLAVVALAHEGAETAALCFHSFELMLAPSERLPANECAAYIIDTLMGDALRPGGA